MKTTDTPSLEQQKVTVVFELHDKLGGSRPVAALKDLALQAAEPLSMETMRQVGRQLCDMGHEDFTHLSAMYLTDGLPVMKQLWTKEASTRRLGSYKPSVPFDLVNRLWLEETHLENVPVLKHTTEES